MANTIKWDGGSDSGHSDAINKLKSLFGTTGYSMLSEEKDLRDVLSKLGEGRGLKWDDVLATLTSQDKALGKVISAIKRYEGHLNYLKKLGETSKPPVAPGFGALSSEEAYKKSGWRTINGANVWTRPPNVSGVTDPIPSQATRYVIPEYPEAALPDEAKTFPLATAEQAAAMRKEDAEAEAIKKSKMTDYERFIYENKGTLGEKGADAKYRQMLLKQLPPFFKDSKLSTKSLIDIGKLIKSAKGIPLVGKLMHPAGLAFAGLGIMDALLKASSASNRAVTGWSGSRMLSGSPSEQFDAMARLAGAKDEQEVLKMYGSLIGQFGSESAFVSIGAALRSAPPGIARLQMAKSLGLDEKQANMLMFLAGQKPLESTKEAQETAARESKLEDMQKWGLRSGSSFTEKIRAASLMLPLEKGLEARGMSWMDILDMANPATLPNILMRRIYNPVDAIDEGIKRQMESQDAAESYDAYESNGGSSVESNDNSKTINMNIEKIEVGQGEAGELANGLVKAADTVSGNARALLTAFGSGFMI